MPWGTAPRLFRWYRQSNVGFPLPVADVARRAGPAPPRGRAITRAPRTPPVEAPILFGEVGP